MKKRIALILALLMLLMAAGCQSAREIPGQAGNDDNGGEVYGEEPEVTGEKAEDTGEVPVTQDAVAYEIVEQDNSIRNDNGDILAKVTYEQVVLLGDAPAYAAINALIEQDCMDYLANSGAYYMTAEELQSMIDLNGMGYGSLYDSVYATVIHNADGILSIRLSVDWFMGGVHNTNHYGVTYDLRTGGVANVEDLLQMSEEEALDTLSALAYFGLKDYYGDALFGDPMDVLSGYTLDDYTYYVENGELVLTFDTYEFAAGAAGAAIIHTGLMIGE